MGDLARAFEIALVVSELRAGNITDQEAITKLCERSGLDTTNNLVREAMFQASRLQLTISMGTDTGDITN